MEYHFATCILDSDRQMLWRSGEAVHVEPQVFHLLTVLAQANGNVVSKDALVETVWGGLNVSDATIAARVSAARSAVGDDGKAQAIIKTVPKRGFQLVTALKNGGAVAHSPVPVLNQRPAIRFASSADGELIAHTHHGNGPPLMRVGHWLSHLELDWESPVWHPLLTSLGAQFTLYRYDQRGTGLSTRGTGNLKLDTFVEDLKAVADANGLERFPIFAASQAVPVAIRFAALYPERVSRMALYGGYAVGRIFRDTDEGEVDEETILGLIRAGWGKEGGAFMSAFTALFMPDATPEQVRSFVRIQCNSISAENAALLRQAVDRLVVEDDLENVLCPVLILHANSDAIQPMSQGQLLASRIKGARFVMLESRNHAPLPQDPGWTTLMNCVTSFCSSQQV